MDSYEYYASLISESNEELYGVPAEESLSEILSSAKEIGSKVVKTSFESFTEILETIAANMIVLSKNLEGYKIHKTSADLVNKIIDLFENIVEDCTYTYEKIFRGWSKKDVENGVEMFNAQLLSSKNKHRELIYLANNMLTKYKETAENIKLDDSQYLSYSDTTKLIKRIIRLSQFVRNNTRKIKVNVINKLKSEALGLGEYADTLIDINKQEVTQMGALLLSTFSHIYVKPNTDLSEDDPAVLRSMKKMEKDIKFTLKLADSYLPNKIGADI